MYLNLETTRLPLLMGRLTPGGLNDKKHQKGKGS